jgi:hypothetical protein
MGDLPIIFSAPMVRALLAGTKTQTRRVVKPQPAWGKPELYQAVSDEDPYWAVFDADHIETRLRIPYAPGDRLYVREACHLPKPGVAHLMYRADHPDAVCIRWRPSIHMPRWASRITLTVTEVRVQRLQEISEADAVAEGVDAVTMDDVPRQAAMSRRSDFSALWNRLHGPDAWGQNPWVVAVSFPVRQGNIDEANP